MDNPYMYCFIRKDLHPSQRIVQTAHAAAKIGEKYHGDTYIVLCSADDEDHLKSIAEYLDSKHIDHEIFFEPDVTEFTAIATQPLVGKSRIPLRKFALLS